MRQSKLVDMCNGPLLSAILRYVFPTVVSSVLMLAFQAADLVVIGRWGSSESLAAVGSVGALIHVIVVMFFGVSTGVDVLVSRYFGAKDDVRIHTAAQTSMAYAVWGGLAMSLVGFLIADWAVGFLKTPPEITPKAVEYVRIYFIAIWPISIFSFGCSVARSIGNTRSPMIHLIVAGSLNCVLNVIFVVPMKMDVAGVAWATMISQCVAAGLMVRLLVREKGPWRLDLNHLKIDWKMLWELMKQGIPSGVSGASFSIPNVLIQSAINYFGASAMAGCAAAGSWEGVVYVSAACFGQAVTCFVGQNFGARKLERMVRCMKYCCLCSALITLTMGILACFFVDDLLRVFSSDPDVLSWGKLRCFLLFPTYFLCGIFEVFYGTLRAVGKAVSSAVTTILGVCLFRMVWVWCFFPMHRTLQMLLLSYPLSWIITSAFCLYLLSREYKILKIRMPATVQ